MSIKGYGPFFKSIRKIARLVLPRFHFEVVPPQKKPVIYVAHHQNMMGPISILAWAKNAVHTWVLSEFTDQKACYHHYVNFTFTQRYGWPQWLAKALAWPISYLVTWLTNSGKMIPVYRGSRKIVKTMQISHEVLLKGEDLIIFPDVDYASEAEETAEIYEGFLHLEKKYYRATGNHLTFIPVYSDRENRRIRLGEDICFTGKESFMIERTQVAQQIRDELNRLSEVEPTQTAYK